MTGFTIRDARPEDISDICAIEGSSFSVPWPRSVLLNFITEEDRICTVAEADGRIGGYICTLSVLDEYHIGSIAAEPALRGRGIGTALVADLIGRARRNGGQYIFLEVRESNAAARALYAKLGFAEVAKRRNYYESPPEDAVLMTLFL